MTVQSRTDARKNKPVLLPDPARRARPLDGLVLDNRKVEMVIGDRLTDAQMTRTITGPNTITLTLWNGDRSLLASGALGQRAMNRTSRVELDGLGFRATEVDKQGTTLMLTFEDEVVTLLKNDGRNQPVRQSRGISTRAHFCAGLIRQAGVPVAVLDENVVQPIKDAIANALAAAVQGVTNTIAQGIGQGLPTRTAAKGLAGDLTVKGVAATSEQRRNVKKALDQAAPLGASDNAILAMLCAGTAEGDWQTAITNNIGAEGPFQLLPSTAKALGVSGSDVSAVAKLFLATGFGNTPGAIALARQGMSPGDIANTIEVGGAGAAFYSKWLGEATKWLGAYSTGNSSSSSTSITETETYYFERLRTESTWAACTRMLVTEVKWRLFVREGVVVIASDTALMRAAPSITVAERSDAVEEIDFQWIRPLRLNEMTASAYVGRWEADPGEPVQVTDLPPDSDKWLMQDVTESLLGATAPLADITLIVPQKPLPEPAPDTKTVTIDGATGATAGNGSQPLVPAMQAMDRQNYPYVWGGGHGAAGTPSTGSSGDGNTFTQLGFDCSGSVGGVLAEAGYDLKVGQPVPGSGWFASTWGSPGQGRYFTVWANDGHVFMELHFPGLAAKSFDTRPEGDSRLGPHLRSVLGPTAGFTPRHWPGQ